jgi:hypothetical protein
VVMVVAVGVIAAAVAVFAARRLVIAVFVVVFVVIVPAVQVGVDGISSVIVLFVPDTASGWGYAAPYEVVGCRAWIG